MPHVFSQSIFIQLWRRNEGYIRDNIHTKSILVHEEWNRLHCKTTYSRQRWIFSPWIGTAHIQGALTYVTTPLINWVDVITGSFRVKTLCLILSPFVPFLVITKGFFKKSIRIKSDASMMFPACHSNVYQIPIHSSKISANRIFGRMEVEILHRRWIAAILRTRKKKIWRSVRISSWPKNKNLRLRYLISRLVWKGYRNMRFDRSSRTNFRNTETSFSSEMTALLFAKPKYVVLLEMVISDLGWETAYRNT